MENLNWTDAQSLAWIPNGKMVTFTAMHQAAWKQYIRIIDENGRVISFETLQGEMAEFPIEGQGSNVGFFKNGSGKFLMKKGLKVQFANSGGEESAFIMTTPSQFFINETVYGGCALYVTEDEGGTDYNDSSFTLQWYELEG